MAEDAPETERRAFARIPFEGRAWLVDGTGRRHRGRVLDLCLQGVLVGLPAAPSTEIWRPIPGERLRLELELFPGEPPLRMEAAVAHVEAGRAEGTGGTETRAGLRCLHLDLEAMTRLRRLVELNLGDAEALDRELEALVREPGD